MRYLTGDEAKEANAFSERGGLSAKWSSCEKSKRGVIIVQDRLIIGEGFNHPPKGYTCEPSVCKTICASYCVHAEHAAIIDALQKGNTVEGSRLYHAKVKEGSIKTVDGPSCVSCSKIILDAGIKEVVLQLHEGYALYNAREFHALSLEALMKK